MPTRGATLKPVQVSWTADPDPVLSAGAPGQWDSGDVLNPSVIARPGGFLNLYSGFEGTTWSTGMARSADGRHWTRLGRILTPSAAIEGDRYIAANGAVIEYRGELLYYYQGGRTPRIYLARQDAQGAWGKRAQPVLGTGPYGSWDELGVADPALIEADGRLYLYYLGMDRARRQRLGIAMSRMESPGASCALIPCWNWASTGPSMKRV